VPILLRTVRRPKHTAFHLQHVLVPIDFQHDVEAALDPARTLARAYGAEITVLTVPERVADEVRRLLPSASALAQEYEAAELERRLDRVVEDLQAAGFRAGTVFATGRPSDAIAAASASLPAELIVLVTDVHGGLSSWYDPSTLQRLLTLPDLTLLLIKEL
jgi:nucleotide-binding universal stress UspA family protein